MKREIWQNGLPILTEDLSYGHSANSDEIRARMLDTFAKGVIANSQKLNESEPFEFTIGTGSTYFSIGTGVAVSPTGERIAVEEMTDFKSDTSLTTDHHSIDGIPGSPGTLTPRSTGNANVLLNSAIQPDSVYYIWLGYLATIDDSRYILKDGTTTERLYPVGTNGYEVYVSSANDSVCPDTSRFILLGIINTNSLSKITDNTLITFADLQEQGRITGKSVECEVPASQSDRAIAYSSGQNLTIDDHVKSIGTGLISNLNPHGIAAEDLGIFSTDGVNHQAKLHTNGIYSILDTGNTGLTSTVDFSLYPEVTINSVSNDDTVKIKPLSSDEYLVVNGIPLSSLTLGLETTFYFVDSDGAAIAEGYYLFYVDSITKTVKRSVVYAAPSDLVLGTEYTDRNNSPICYIKWAYSATSGTPTGYNLLLHTLVDLRVFGNIKAQNVRRDLLVGLEVGGALGTRTKYLYNARIVGTGNASTLNAYRKFPALSGKTFLVYITDDVTLRTVTFTSSEGSGDVTIESVVNQLNQVINPIAKAEISVIANIPYIKLLSSSRLHISSGTATADLGFVVDSVDSGDIKEIHVVGDVSYKYECYYDISNVLTSTVSRVGNTLLNQAFAYDGLGNILSITESVQNHL